MPDLRQHLHNHFLALFDLTDVKVDAIRIIKSELRDWVRVWKAPGALISRYDVMFRMIALLQPFTTLKSSIKIHPDSSWMKTKVGTTFCDILNLL